MGVRKQKEGRWKTNTSWGQQLPVGQGSSSGAVRGSAMCVATPAILSTLTTRNSFDGKTHTNCAHYPVIKSEFTLKKKLLKKTTLPYQT